MVQLPIRSKNSPGYASQAEMYQRSPQVHLLSGSDSQPLGSQFPIMFTFILFLI